MKLTPDQRREILNEMELAELFTEKLWAQRFGISIPTVRRLRREARERHKLIRNVSGTLHVLCFNSPNKGAKSA
jgi:AraC-like DNA-binding protein